MLKIPEENDVVEAMQVYASMEKEVLTSLITGTFPRAKLDNTAVKLTIDDDVELSNTRPSVYNTAVAKRKNGKTPSAVELYQVIQLALMYCISGLSFICRRGSA